MPDGFENDQLMAMENLEDGQAVPDGFENAQLMAVGNFDEEQACFDVSEGFENDQLMAMENFEEEQAFFEFPEGFENAQLIHKVEPEEEKQSFDAESSQYWGSIDYIPHERAISLVLGHFDPHDSVNSKDCEVSTSRGTFNKVFIVTLPGGTKYVLRVPRFGIPESWNSDEETAFLTTVNTMEYVRTMTDLPIPQVLAYDHTHDNAIKHPYSILSYFTGRNVYWAWGDATDPNLEATRQRILRSLARTVSVLSKLSFDSHGSLQFEGSDIQSPHIGPEKRVTHHTYDPDVGLIHETRMRNPYDSHRAYLEGKFEKAEELGISTIASVPNTVKLGELKILRMLLKCFPTGPAHLDAEGRERFSIVPPDFDWQNILVDDDGNVTGLIDWDDMRTQHGLKGWASCPRFLRTDWIYIGMPPWEEDINMSPQDLLRYRRDYANYIAEAVNGEGDACFTMKSAVWQAIEQALKQSWDRTAILTKILTAAQPEIQHPQDFLHDVGRNGLRPDDEVELQMRFHAYLACSPGADTQYDV
ncbi:hypothetical protein IWX90DRAFT_435830 [Phyllosticta citrichinensis]|uniref:Aminoglycoside phosphotransferase domain-containing protein n=1 Tax=Phyllosticta citrichinensis TaxID=1130410 RepID=A0ABR1XQQ3_9PEZI